MIDSFTSARSKLDWAYRHLQKLRDEINCFQKTEPYPVTPQFNTDRTECRLYISVTKPIPKHWGLIVGDCIHNVRSALDHVTWELAESFTGPRPKDTGTQFPIFDSPLSDEGKHEFWRYGEPPGRAARMLTRIPVYAQALIEQAQPYHSRNITKHPLRLCRELNNTDKHKIIPVIVSAVEHSAFSITPYIRVDDGRFFGGPFEDGTEVGWFRFVEPVPTEVHVNPDFIVEIVVDDGLPFIGVDHRLSVAIAYVRYFIQALEGFPNPDLMEVVGMFAP